jgi:hypothetical protein
MMLVPEAMAGYKPKYEELGTSGTQCHERFLTFCNKQLHFNLFSQDILSNEANFLQNSSKGTQVYKNEYCNKITNLSIIHTCKMMLLLSRISNLSATRTSITLCSMTDNVPAHYVISICTDRKDFIHRINV